MKTLDLSLETAHVPALDKLDRNAFKNLISKCGKYISRIIYEERNQKLHIPANIALPSYIAKYCFNVTSLNYTASYLFPRDIELLAENCNKIKELKLKLHTQCIYQSQLTKLFEVNKNLEYITLYELGYMCPSLMKLPEHKIKAITFEQLQFYRIENNILFSVCILLFFFYFVLIIGIFLPYQ